MFRQILAGIEASEADVIYFAEHDILYPPSHFTLVPTKPNRFWYNENVWKVRVADGHALHYNCQQTSGLCAYRHLLLPHYRERVSRTELKLAELGNSREYRKWIREQGFEPGTHNREQRVDDHKAASWKSERPLVDLRHKGTLTPSRWEKKDFRNKKFTRGWMEGDGVPGWGVTRGRMKEFLSDLA
jgi:hypothetical protein